MILLRHQDWWELSEAIMDDSAGALDDPPFTVEIVDDENIILHFLDPAEETLFRLRWLNM